VTLKLNKTFYTQYDVNIQYYYEQKRLFYEEERLGEDIRGLFMGGYITEEKALL
jgi:hypothetical protein